VEWAFLTGSDTGGSAITSYELQMDDGAGGAFVEVVGFSSPYTLNSHLITAGIVSGNTYRVQYRAKNIHGWGPFSSETSILAATTPSAPGTPTTTIEYDLVKVAWAAPSSTGGTGVALTAYRVEIQHSDGSTYSEELTNCDGGHTNVLTNRECHIPMNLLTASPFSLSQGSSIIARVTAINTIGVGATSPDSTVTASAETVPHKPSSPPMRGAATSASQLVVDWAALTAPNNGGSAVFSYNLQWDNGSGTISTDLIGSASNFTSLTHTQSAGVTAGGSYKFRYRASNKYGWGPFSDEVSILAASVPDQVAQPTTSISNTFVKISWTEPTTNSAAITAYDIVIKESDGSTFTADTSNCDGTAAAIVLNKYCFVPMSTLRGSPFSLPFRATVAVKVRAKNAIGWGIYSSESTTAAQIQTEPVQMAAPVRGSGSSASQIQVDWTALVLGTDIGDSAITSYNLYWDQGTGVYVSLVGESSDSLATTFTVSSGITGGSTYNFKVRAKNKWGFGDFSSSTAILAAGAPD